MTLLEQLEHDYRFHVKARKGKRGIYPARFEVPENYVSWEIEFPEYKPLEFSSDVVLDKNTHWADSCDISLINRKLQSFVGEVKFNPEGLPLNPFGRTGICGRGLLGKWGANFAVDGLLTTLNPLTNLFEVLTITRTDTGETAIPGGMVDTDETIFETRNRELAEELSISKENLSNAVYEKVVSKGYVDDPRNTDNAWLETTVIHSHFLFEKAMQIKLSAGDDAKDYQWLPITQQSIQHFYASHGLSVLKSIKAFLETNSVNFNEESRSNFLDML